jgi:hypothetical protein
MDGQFIYSNLTMSAGNMPKSCLFVVIPPFIFCPKFGFKGVVHGGEYPYTLGPELFGNYVLDEEDREVQAKLVRTIGTFVLDGFDGKLLNMRDLGMIIKESRK